jgi:hypothetical protein
MPIQRRELLHNHGPALWPDHKPEAEVLHVKATTPKGIWLTTYQGLPVPAMGAIFAREMWEPADRRYDPSDDAQTRLVWARYLSYDTAQKKGDLNAQTACVIGEILPDYRLRIRWAWADQVTFPEMPEIIQDQAQQWNWDGKVRGILIEDKVSGTSALQVLHATAPLWIQDCLVAVPVWEDKISRANQAAVWCRLGMVLLPWPSEQVEWLGNYTSQLYAAPGALMDMVDATSQLIMHLHEILSEGYRTRVALGLVDLNIDANY